MLKFRKPPQEPDTFAKAVLAAKTAIQHVIDVEKRAPKSAEFIDAWRAYKALFLMAQFDKCGYCEIPLASHPGDVEHFSPKAELQVLPDDSAAWGGEGEGDYSVNGRRPRTVSELGYWWRAYDWANYLAACNRCNSGWKRNLFPVKEVPRLAPQQKKVEDELLLNPFRGEDPADHLEYDDVGQVKPRNKSPYGGATIQTCGLDRDSLVRLRKEIAPRAYELLDEYVAANSLPTEGERRAALARVSKDFRRMCAEDCRLGFPGMVRAIFKQKLELNGDDWNVFLGQHEPI